MKPSFSETHHAVLFALFTKHTILLSGQEQGEASIRRALRHYGEQRGKRMRLRALADGQELTMTNYLIYSEWQPSGFTLTQNVMEETFPDVRMKTSVCPWNSAWEEYNLLPYGHIYCQEIDEALVRGFNPKLSIEVRKTLSNDGEPCDFTYRKASLLGADTLEVIQHSRKESRGKNTMPWDYHCGHLYHTFHETLIDDLGINGEKAIQAALKEFQSLFNQKDTQRILDYQGTDFNQLPV